ncbi:hypothetical protein PHYPO_G00163100 [Pangasianodon hypophthalmus]|uniref:Uncharacterized protein n=1 Tax=Pangasianodon hypophthalmus TaxID=310915 RepID=A0A5N5JTR0_PANHP|nr:hypothetical protein PHYPO_G00163100 [Pangasianodon hypophthalmus]
MERPRLMRLRRLQRQCRSQRRRRLRPSSIPPVHPFLFFLSPSVRPFLPSLHPSIPLSPSLSLPLFPLFQQVSSPRRTPLSTNRHQRNIFINNFVNTGSGF